MFPFLHVHQLAAITYIYLYLYSNINLILNLNQNQRPFQTFLIIALFSCYLSLFHSFPHPHHCEPNVSQSFWICFAFESKKKILPPVISTITFFLFFKCITKNVHAKQIFSVQEQANWILFIIGSLLHICIQNCSHCTRTP